RFSRDWSSDVCSSDLMSALPISNLIGSPISGLILDRINWWGMAGWRWVFILEGIPAVIFGIITLFYLTDWPHEARWLPEDERQRSEERRVGTGGRAGR